MDYLTPVLLLAVIFFLTELITIVTRRLYLHPLSHIPGPPLWIITRVPFAYNLIRGRLPYTISSIHDKYGPIVRLAPNEVNFITAEAWNDIYSLRKGGDGTKRQMPKDPFLYFTLPGEDGTRDMFFEADDKEHARQRGVFAHSFSEKSLRDQEPIIQHHIGRMVDRLRLICDGPVDMSAWFNFALFDTIGDLVVGETFNCMETMTLHPWAKTFFSFSKGIAIMGMTQRFWPLTPLLMLFVPKEMQDAETNLRRFTEERVDMRLEKKLHKKDIISTITPFLDAPGASSLTLAELNHNTQIFIVGGSETTSTALSGLFYYLLSSLHTLHNLTTEIHSAFSSPDEITLSSVRSLKYLDAVTKEALRLFGPVAGLLRRITPEEGCEISGVYVPGNTTVAVDSYAASHSESNFHHAGRFIPERWLDPHDPDTRYPDGYTAADFVNDKRKVVQPFSMGPRNCIGKNLGKAVLGLLVSRLMWEFDFVLMDESKRWVEGMEVYVWYDRPPLMCMLKPKVDV